MNKDKKDLIKTDTRIPKYEKLLAATTTNTCENVASMADINIEEESFWQESLQSIADQIQDFLKELSA